MLYPPIFGRFPDMPGLKHWTDAADTNGLSRLDICDYFIDSKEFEIRFGSETSDEVFVENLYTYILGREADPEGRDYWLQTLDNPMITRSMIVLEFAESLEYMNLFATLYYQPQNFISCQSLFQRD